MRISLLALFAFVTVSELHAAGLTTVSVSLDQVIESPRWMFDGKTPVKGGPLIVQLIEGKKSLIAKDRAKCMAALTKAYGLGKDLAPWILWNHLQCALLKDKGGRVVVEPLAQVIHRVESEPSWLVFGPAVTPLRQAYAQALLALAEAQVKSDRRKAWSTLDKLQRIRTWLNAEERANIFRWSGELSFIEQNLSSAQEFLARSLNEKENAELRTRLESIRSSLMGAQKTPQASSGTASATLPRLPEVSKSDDVGISDQEREIFGRLNRAYEAQDFISAIKDGVELLQKFPGSRRASEAADRVLDIYLSLSNRSDDKFRHVRETAVSEMQKVDSGRLSRWASNAYAKGNYQDALTLAERAYDRYAGHPDSTKILLLAGKAALAAGEYDDARKHFEKLIHQHGGTSEAAEATFRLGLLDFRQKRYGPAAAFFERLLALSSGRDWEYRALYWQWRAQQRIDPAKSALYAQPLVDRYPLSYYGLRARAETNSGSLELPKEKIAVKADLRLLEYERLAWERFHILLKAGWLREAERELDSLPEPQSNEERLIRARFWAATLRYDNAISLVNKVFDESPALLQVSVLRIVFPSEFSNYVLRESKTTGVNSEWILALIRQESSFRPEVKSPANAMGVMQLLPSTAQELARDLRLKDFTAESLLNPDVNIKLGSLYLSRLVKNFNGNVPLALAAYNAGPTRLRRWLGARKDLGPLEGMPSSTPEAEVWIDEMPWEETSFYVKAILRNWMIYRILDGSKLALSEPIWVDAKPASR